jgi:hypothetical protein
MLDTVQGGGDGEQGRREFYSFEADQQPLHPLGDGTAVCQAILTRLRPHLARAQVDAYSDYARDMPTEVRDVEAWLTDLGRAQSPACKDPGMAVVLDLRDDEHWRALWHYGAWSINAELWGRDDADMGTLHDSAYSIVVALTDDDVETLEPQVGSKGRFVSTKELVAEEAVQEGAARNTRRATRTARVRALLRRFRLST